VGVGIGFAGVAILLQPGKGGVTVGLFLCLLSAVMWSVGTVAAPRLPMPEDSFAATGWEMLAGGLVMLPFALTHLGGTSPSPGAILGWLYLVSFGSVIGYTAYTWLLANAPLGLVSTYAYANPVVAILLGLLFRGESLTWRILIGALVVVAAVALVVRRDAPSATQREEGVR
jgi:drug/metabolite transporter (DMT)-like permease